MTSMRLSLATLALLATLPALPAAAYTCTETDLSTGTPASLYAIAPSQSFVATPPSDSRWSVTSSPAGYARAAAYDVPPVSGWYAPNPGEPGWVTSAVDAGGASWDSLGGAYEYSTTFTKTPGIAVFVHGVFAVDNAADVYVNGVPYLHYAPPSDDWPAAFSTYGNGKAIGFMSYDRPDLVRDGVNVLTFRVQNYAQSPEGLFFWGGTRSCS